MSQLFFKSKTASYYATQSINELLYSQVFTNAVWTLTNGTLTAGQTDPSGGSTAYTFKATSANATLLQTVDAGLLSNKVFSIYLKRKTGTGNISLTINGANYTVTAITGAWARYSITAAVSGSISCGVKVSTLNDEVYVAWAQLETGNTAATYVANTSSRLTVTQITDTDYPVNTTRGCAYLDGTFYVMTPDGTINGSDLEDAASWNALNFIQAIIQPGAGVYLTNYQSYVMALKQYSTEFFYDAANPAPGSPLGSVPSMAFSIGCASEDSVKQIAGSIIWMGQMLDGQGRGIFRMNGTTPEKISDTSVEKILDADDLAEVSSWVCKVGSHTLYGLTLGTVGVTLVYDFEAGIWTLWTYLTNDGDGTTITAISATGTVTAEGHPYSDGKIVNISGTGISDGFQVATNVTADTFDIQNYGAAFSGSATCDGYTEDVFPIIASTASGGFQWMQTATGGNLYVLSESIYSDPVGAIAARIRTNKWDGGTSDWKRISSTELVGDKVSTYCLIRKTDNDYVTYSGFRSMNMEADRTWVKACGRTSRRALELLHVENSAFRVEALEIETQR